MRSKSFRLSRGNEIRLCFCYFGVAIVKLANGKIVEKSKYAANLSTHNPSVFNATEVWYVCSPLCDHEKLEQFADISCPLGSILPDF